MLQNPLKVIASSVILTTTLVTPVMTNSMTIHAETQEQSIENQVPAERIFHVIGKGDVNQIKDKERRQFSFSPYEPTGLYAGPNEKITIKVEGTQNIKAYIGTYSYDGAWNQDNLVKSFTLNPGENTIESPNGGMIYFYNQQNGGSVQAEVKTGGVPVPFFELGKHTKQDLINMLDTYPNAHAVELKGERSLITASPERVKKYLIGSNTDPVELLKKIDESIRLEDRVAGLSEEEADKHYVHFVEDNHSSYYMYAYTYRTAYVKDAIQVVLDINQFTKDGWGPWHEMGHQRQPNPWTWNGLGEVTNNIYSMSVQRAYGLPSRLEKDGVYQKAFTYLNKPQSEKDYNKIDDVFVKLVMFWQLDLAFREEFYPKLHQLYRAIPKEELPKTNDEKIQNFIYNTSKVAQKNLLPFFDQWGLIATPEIRQKIESLNYPILTAPIWEATDSKPVIVEENGETQDTEPKLTVPDGATMNVGDSFNPMAGVSATDKEDGDLTDKVTVEGKVDTSKAGNYELTYTVKDSKDQKVTAKQTVTVKKKEETKDEAPELKVPSETTITQGDQFDPMAGVSAIDKEDGDITPEVKYEGDVDTNTPGTYMIKYTVKDSAGHLATQTQTITVKEKPAEDQEPELTVQEETVLTVGDRFDPMSGVKAIDKEDGDITSKVTYSGDQGTDKDGTYKIKYVVEDSKGHRVIKLRTVIVKTAGKPLENQAPVLKVPFTTTLHIGDTFDPMTGVSASDKEEGNLTDKVKHKGNVDTTKPGKYIVEYWVVDSQEVNATATQTVIVEENRETPDMEPKLTVPGGETMNVGDSFDPMTGVSATDEEDGDLTDKVTVEGKVDTIKPGTYVLTYTVKDSKGHKATAEQTVTVKETEELKDEAPVLTVPAEVNMNVGDSFDPMSGVKAIDKEDGDLTKKVVHFGEVDTSKAGTYEVKFLVRDSGGNEAIVTQKVVVKDKDNGNGSDNANNGLGNNNDSDNGNNNTNNGNGSDNNNTNNGNSLDNGSNGTNNSNSTDTDNNNISNISTSDKKEDTYKELPKTGTSTNNSAAMGILMVLAGMVLTIGRKFRKVLK
ncbi:immunoglobulin-like domain-containing protein [Bacillus toyonensis]|uniref:immunoglobulin-like domain-containing protein n=1 Tax=Bacillus toyonensis TaxID=155322 RepID=UPI000BEDAC7D|nr:immunoglobulin-like domain-containing protein [Bacillus toyonensis]PDZ87407.1 S-layer protein [Bacillus toyonensis]PEA71851.1 S-layer protein [Bacillus toyonensis]PEC39071.1 S-layer protein [Bacillus toyonensis]PEJ92748.1 S-layer protein [Bacillus toyonensis]PEL01095.1 S-layer protein [Bacillus toyonensis]